MFLAWSFFRLQALPAQKPFRLPAGPETLNVAPPAVRDRILLRLALFCCPKHTLAYCCLKLRSLQEQSLVLPVRADCLLIGFHKTPIAAFAPQQTISKVDRHIEYYLSHQGLGSNTDKSDV